MHFTLMKSVQIKVFLRGNVVFCKENANKFGAAKSFINTSTKLHNPQKYIKDGIDSDEPSVNGSVNGLSSSQTGVSKTIRGRPKNGLMEKTYIDFFLNT